MKSSKYKIQKNNWIKIYFHSGVCLTSGVPISVWISDFEPNPANIDFSTLWVGVFGGGGGGGGVHLKTE